MSDSDFSLEDGGSGGGGAKAPRRAAAARRPVYDDPSDGDDASGGSDFSGSGDDSDASDDFGGGGGGSKKGKAPTAAAAPPKAKPAAAKKKAAAPPKKPTAPAAGPSSVNTSIDEEDGEDDARPTQATAGGTQARAVEDVYQKKSQLEHILLRPDTYVGSTERQVVRAWVHDGDGGDGEGGAEGATPARGAAGMQCRDMSYVPGLYKIFDEILVNAADNKVRDGAMDCLRVDVEPTTGWVRVWNNGAGVPVEVHKGEGVYVPELIFGHLLTSSNYNDAEQKVTGGRNGYGAKLANIFSTEFVVETCDGSRRRSYKQSFHANMTVIDPPVLGACGPKDEWTRISFKPDLAKFGMAALEPDTVSLMRKRTFDMAGVLGSAGVKVFFNGARLPVKGFKDYVGLYLPSIAGEDGGGLVGEDGVTPALPPTVHCKVGPRWEVVVAPSDGQFTQVSFVNAICTTKGGTHVNAVVDQIAKAVSEALAKKHKGCGVKPFMVKNYLAVFVNAQIVNPAFDSQTKETLTLRASSFGSKCDLPASFLKAVSDAGVADRVLSFASFKQDRQLKKTDGAKRARITGLPKLMDANDAGGKHSGDCTLILTEGDSAKSLVVGGLSVSGRDKFGVFPLRGKLLNVREASASQVAANAEIQNIKQILGLQHGKAYESAASLRYGHLMIMTDQDHDGSHIKGLIMNFFHTFYPSLLRVPGFLQEFITPIVKCTKGKAEVSFYTLPEYEAWRAEKGGAPGWRVKYYKGLGTSTEKEAKAYFSAIASHRKDFVWEGPADGSALELAFSKKKVEERKAWLGGCEDGVFLDQTASHISYSDFVHKELILFSRADLERSIPSVVDGLKPGQRKILYCCFKRNLRADIKVAQLAGYVSEHSAYHHGEASLQATIVGLAQGFVGANNINLLVPQGQFGTRLMGGRDAASARYIYTRLDPMARVLFDERDDALLHYLAEEGQTIEPRWYVPLIPTVLVNGAEGIGTGWSTFVPNYNPADLVAGVRALLGGEEPPALVPWYRGFTGRVEVAASKSAGLSYALTGTVTQTGPDALDITELPVRRWTQDYKEWLEGLLKPGERGEPATLVDYREHHTDASVHFSLALAPGRMRPLLASPGPEAALKLTTKLSVGNMVLFDADGRIRRYESADAILRDFFTLRLRFYTRRRECLIRAAEADQARLSNRARFILAVVAGDLAVSGRSRSAVEAQLDADGFDRIAPVRNGGKQSGGGGGGGGGGGEDGPGGAGDLTADDAAPLAAAASAINGAAATYDYLLTMPIYSLTLEKVRELQAAADAAAAAVDALRATGPEEMYRADLDALDAAMASRDAAFAADVAKLASQRAKAGKAAAKAVKARAAKGGGKKKKKGGWDSGDDASETEEEDGGCSSSSDSDGDGGASPAPSIPAPRPRAPGKRGAGATAAAAPAAPAPAAGPSSTVPAPVPLPPPAPPAPAGAGEGLSLMDRLAGRLGSLNVDRLGVGLPGVPMPAVAAVPAGAPPAVAAKKAPAPRKPAAPRAAAPPQKKKAAAPKTTAALSSDDDAAPAAAAAAPPTSKARPRSPSSSGGGEEGAEEAAKVRRLRESPFHKGSGSAGGAGEGEGGEGGEGEEEPRPPAATRPPPRRAAAAAAGKVLKKAAAAASSSEEEEEESESESESERESERESEAGESEDE